MSYQVQVEQATPANSPNSGEQFIYPKTGGWAVKNSAGVEQSFSTNTNWYCGTSGGSANAQTLTPLPAVVSYATAIGQEFLFVAVATNTTAMTIAISGLAALNTTMGSVALPVGGVVIGRLYVALIESATSIRVLPYDAASVDGDTFNGAIIPHQTIGITGTTTNNSAQAGAVGELLTATIATPGTALSVSGTSYNVIPTPFLSLTAGDWNVWGTVCFLPAATTSITQVGFGLSVTSATLPAAGSGLGQETHAALVPTAIPQCFSIMQQRVSIGATTPYYLVAAATFSISTITAFGTLYARRVR